MKIGIVIPSARLDNMERLFSGFHHLSPLHFKHKVQVLLELSPKVYTPSITAKWRKRFEAAGWPVKVCYDVPDRSKIIRINLMRERGCQLWKDADAFLVIDDDFIMQAGTPCYRRNSGERYAECFDYLARFPRCGGVFTKSAHGGFEYGYKIKPTWKQTFGTDHGMVLRNMWKVFGGCYNPPDTWKLRGGWEDPLAFWTRMAHGYFIAKQMNNPAIHSHRYPGHDKVKSEGVGKVVKFPIHDIDIMNANCFGYVKKKYGVTWELNPKTKDHSRIPPSIKESYLELGGPPDIMKNKKFIVDYAKVRP